MNPGFRKRDGEFGFELTDSLLHSPAYMTLTPAGRIVLNDMLRIYFRASSWESRDLADVGFQYAFGVCDANVSEHTFERARKQIVKHGFFETPPELQNCRLACSAGRYVGSEKWRTYKPNSKEDSELRRRTAARERRLERTKENRRKAVDQLVSGRPKQKKQGTNLEDIDTANMEAIQKRKPAPTFQQPPKMEDIKGVASCQFGGHLSIPYSTPFRVAPLFRPGSVLPWEKAGGKNRWRKNRQRAGNFVQKFCCRVLDSWKNQRGSSLKRMWLPERDKHVFWNSKLQRMPKQPGHICCECDGSECQALVPIMPRPVSCQPSWV